MIDATTGLKRATLSQAVDRSKGGMTMRSPMRSASRPLRSPARTSFTCGGRHPLIDGIAFGEPIADFRQQHRYCRSERTRAKIVISQHRGAPCLCHSISNSICRHLIENVFCKLKDLKRIRRAS